MRRSRRALACSLVVAMVPRAMAMPQDHTVAERERALAQAEIPSATTRWVLPDQGVVVWLPSFLREVGDRAEGKVVFVREGSVFQVTIIREEVPAGTGVAPHTDARMRQFVSKGTLHAPTSSRMFELAGMPAIEVIASYVEHDQQLSLTAWEDPEGRSLGLLLVHYSPDLQGLADATIKTVARNLTFIEAASSEEFESTRSWLSTGYTGDASAESRDFFVRVAEPPSIGQAWVAERASALGARHPMLLFDALLHRHPRARRVALEALLPLASDDRLRDFLLRFGLRDSDPVVRYHTALSAVRDVERVDALVRDLLSTAADDDSVMESAGSGALQLLALLPDEDRRELLVHALQDPSFGSSAGRAVATFALDEWGAAAATPTLSKLWNESEDTAVSNTALSGLLRRGDTAAIAEARSRLAEPYADHPISLSEALSHILTHAPFETTVEDWDEMLATLEAARDDESVESVDSMQTERVEGALATLESFREHLAELAEHETPDDKAQALAEIVRTSQSSWARERYRKLYGGRPLADSQVLTLQIDLAQPGTLIAAVASLLQRLQLGSAEMNEHYQYMLGYMAAALLGEFPDPILDPVQMSLSSGIDMDGEWRLLGWFPVAAKGPRTSGGAVGPPMQFRLPCHDPEQFLRFYVRASNGESPLSVTAQNLFVGMPFSPLIPMMLGMAWEEARKDHVGESTEVESGASARYSAIIPIDSHDTESRYRLLRFATYRDKLPSVDETFLGLSEDFASVTPGTEVFVGESLDVPPDDEGAGLTSTLDLATLFQELDGMDGQILNELAGDSALRFTTRTYNDGETMRTLIELQGLASRFASVLRDQDLEDLDGPRLLLPATTCLWAGVTLDIEAFLAQLRKSEELAETESPKFADVLALFGLMRGEAGMAVVDVPSFGPDAEESWKNSMVFYFAVDPVAARLLLAEQLEAFESESGRELFRDESTVVALVGDLLVMSPTQEPLLALEEGPRFADSAGFERLTDKAPATANGHGLLNTDEFARGLLERFPKDADNSLMDLTVRFLSAFGPVVGWLDASPTEISGQLVTQANVLSEANHQRVRRLVGFAGHNGSSIRSNPIPAGFPIRDIERMDFSIDWDGDEVDLIQAALGSRLEQVPTGNGELLTNKASTPLPAHSEVAIPIVAEGMARWLRSERGLEVNHPEIRALAAEIRDGETDPALIVRSIIEWVGENLEYQSTEETSGVETLASREADCTEYTRLTVALCRSLGIPAREVGGIALGPGMFYGHAWAEVFLDRWYEIDPTWGLTHVPGSHVRLKDADLLRLVWGESASIQTSRIEGQGGRVHTRIPCGLPAGQEVWFQLSASGDFVLVASNWFDIVDSEVRTRVFFSSNRGLTFEELEEKAPTRDGQYLSELIAAHGRLLRSDASTGLSTLSALDPISRQWNQVVLPANVSGALELGVPLFLSEVAGGFLLVADSFDRPRFFRLDEGLSTAIDLGPPEWEGEFLLGSAPNPLLAILDERGRTRLVEHVDGEWVSLTRLFSHFWVQQIRGTGSSFEFDVFDSRESSHRTLVVEPPRLRKTFRELPYPDHGGVRAISDEFTWYAWVEDGQLVLLRDPR